jgi:hypothetical protein
MFLRVTLQLVSLLPQYGHMGVTRIRMVAPLTTGHAGGSSFADAVGEIAPQECSGLFRVLLRIETNISQAG